LIRRRQVGRSGLQLAFVTAAAVVAGCTLLPSPTPELGHESMPGPASVWLTSDPATPTIPVPVVLGSLHDPAVRLRHTFVAGQVLRGDFATSQGRYRMTALDGACSIDLPLGPSQAAEVVLTLDGDAGCSLAVARLGNMDDPAMWKDEPAVFITNGGRPDETPFLEPISP
jgi:hypothetical protein